MLWCNELISGGGGGGGRTPQFSLASSFPSHLPTAPPPVNLGCLPGAAATMYTVIRIDGRLHQPHRMAPDQTIRVMEDKFDICDGYIWFFPKFPMEIFYRFEDFRLDSLSKGWKSPTFRSFPIIFPLQRMEILEVSKISNNNPFQRMEISAAQKGNPWSLRQKLLWAIRY